ncbi:MAG: hypothetical protein KJ676_06930 [Alphaproteobacteria bacterium]|nr:hypothetical protein [Alphaproteobacteria bacterium]MBU1526238.1 hypothetical protein [Alphaproteobacteria bacterium]MBU2118058.1 hypothetical protein [Alphaproteobacteria bacterium]MBU2351395.1 hypothetical protein [Alphaproteobacteria bacterium]MBU2382083.1 hypothetical protein [Alphaproteobacteria bacterium]
MKPLVLNAALALTLAACTPAEEPAPAPAEVPAAQVPAAVAADHTPLNRFLTAYTADAMAPLSYASGTSGDLTFVLFSGPEYCGSGGCTLLILGGGDEIDYAVLGETTVTRAPIRVLSTSANGRPDVGVQVAGGGAEPHEALLAFDGTKYPSNPTVPPARRVDGAEGQVVIADDAPLTSLKG